MNPSLKLPSLPLKENEMMVVIRARLRLNEQNVTPANLFFQTFRKDDNGNWQIVRSYFETNVEYNKMNTRFS